MKHIYNFKTFESIDVTKRKSTLNAGEHIIKNFDLNLSNFFNQGKYELSKTGKVKINDMLTDILIFLKTVKDDYDIRVKISASESPSTPPKGMKYGDLSKLRAKTATSSIKQYFNNNLNNPKIIISQPNIIIPTNKEIENYKNNVRPKLRNIMNSVNANDPNAIKSAKQQVANVLNKVYKNKRYFKVEISVVGKTKVEKPDKPKKGIAWDVKFKFKPGKSKTTRRKCKTTSCRYLDKQRKKRKKHKRY